MKDRRKMLFLVLFASLTIIQDFAGAAICGLGRAYDDRVDMCCCSTPSSCRVYKQEATSTCCGHYVADTQSGEYCCGSNNDRICRKVTVGDGKCGGKKFSPPTEVCCDGVIRGTLRGGFCCGKESYHPTWGKCCNGVVRSVVTGTFCCGTQNFRPGYECCDPVTERIRVRGRC